MNAASTRRGWPSAVATATLGVIVATLLIATLVPHVTSSTDRAELVSDGSAASQGSSTAVVRPGPTWFFRAVHEPSGLTDPATGLSSHTVYRPADLAAVPFDMPIVLWGNGGCRSTSREFSYFLHQMASYGYFIVARGDADLPLVAAEVHGLLDPRPQELIRALDWALEQNKAEGGPFYGRLDPSRVVVSGQSCGAGEAASASMDDRVTTAILWNQGCFGGLKVTGSTEAECFARQRPPTLWVTGGTQDVGYPPARQDFLEAKDDVPLAWADNPDVSHTFMWADETIAVNGLASTGRTPAFYQNEPLVIAWKWLDYVFYDNQQARRYFFGKGCGLCIRGGWHLETKN